MTVPELDAAYQAGDKRFREFLTLLREPKNTDGTSLQTPLSITVEQAGDDIRVRFLGKSFCLRHDFTIEQNSTTPQTCTSWLVSTVTDSSGTVHEVHRVVMEADGKMRGIHSQNKHEAFWRLLPALFSIDSRFKAPANSAQFTGAGP